MPSVTLEQMRAFAPNGRPNVLQAIADHSEEAFSRHRFFTLPRVHGILAQTAEETGGYTTLSENLNYSAERAHEVWPRLFPTPTAAAPYVGNLQRFAEKVYGGRKDLGNTHPGDGWKYRGQGLLQTTGRGWAVKLQALSGLPLVDHPEYATDDEHMLEVACANFASYDGIMEACDRYDIVAVTRLVNGGLINLGARQNWLSRARRYITTLGSGQAAHDPAVEVEPHGPSAPPAGAPLTGVFKLQFDLNRLGFSPKLPVTGFYGPMTTEAVRWFQRGHGLRVDGRAGQRVTLPAIEAALARAA